MVRARAIPYHPPAMSTAIVIDQIVKSYPGAPTPAVDRVSLTINPGDLFFLLGPSGCGKTTLLRMIAGFIDPTSGRILFATSQSPQPRDITHLPPNLRNTGMVFQSYALWPHMTVAKNVAFGLEIRKVPKDEINRRVAEALEMVQMGHLAQRKPNALSGGQQQRVALARALVVKPDVLLLDEPLSNLDAKLRVELRSEIRRICKTAGITTVYVTHDQKEALSMADGVAILQAGRIVQQGSPAELYRFPGSKFVAEFLGETNFLSAKITATTPGTGPDGRPSTELATPAGPMRSTHPLPPGAQVGSDVLLSLRPEALTPARHELGNAENLLRGNVVETTYLGELAQQIVQLTPGTAGVLAGGSLPRVKVAVLNPGPGAVVAPNTPAALTINPVDVVMVPAG
jgi:iron(III) transport system ATP-binding protein